MAEIKKRTRHRLRNYKFLQASKALQSNSINSITGGGGWVSPPKNTNIGTNRGYNTGFNNIQQKTHDGTNTGLYGASHPNYRTYGNQYGR